MNDITNPITKSPITSLAGLAAALTQFWPAFDGNADTIATTPGVIAGLAFLLMGFAARDSNKSSEQTKGG